MLSSWSFTYLSVGEEYSLLGLSNYSWGRSVALKVEQKGISTTYYRYYISSLAMTAKAALYAVRSHWGIENKLHWVLDVIFKEDQARTRSGNGSKNMEIVRHIITNLLRQVAGNASLKVKRKKAAWSVDFLEKVLRQAA
jgi:predicted transposase YbfD/YdcC